MISQAESTVLLIPVFNEAANIPALSAELRAHFPGAAICWINDGSTDDTEHLLRATGDRWLRFPFNLGIGPAMQAGFRFALENGFEFVIRMDGDGQHPPSECVKLAERMRRGDVDAVIGSRFLGVEGYRTTWRREMGIRALAALLSRVCGCQITDPTSGFQMLNRRAIEFFSRHYPADYPEPEALALLARHGYRFCEAPVSFRPRRAGVSSIGRRGAIFYALKVGLALFVDRFRAPDSRFARAREEKLS